MAAIDRLYLETYEDYVMFKDWCEDQILTDKYGQKIPLKSYLYNKSEKDFLGKSSSVMCAPYYVDAFIIRNCPLGFIQEAYKFNYGDLLEKIKNGELYSKVVELEFEPGKHFKCIKHPGVKFNYPYGCRNWFIDVEPPSEFGYFNYSEDTRTWDSHLDFVSSGWKSSTAFVPSIKSLKRHLIKNWKLPIGTRITAVDRYVGDDYIFIIKK